MAVLPWTAVAALAIGAATALASYIDKQREVIGYEGEIKEAFNEANREIALHTNYLSELADSGNIEDNRLAYETAKTEADDYLKQLEKNKRKIEDLNRALGYMNVFDAPETFNKYEQEIAGLEEQNSHLEAALISRNHIIEKYKDFDSIDEMFAIHPERYDEDGYILFSALMSLICSVCGFEGYSDSTGMLANIEKVHKDHVLDCTCRNVLDDVSAAAGA